MNQLARRNIIMVTEKQAHVHVSGHPGRNELSKLYSWIRPEILVPVHGERRHMAEQARFGLSAGIPKVIVQSNGDVVRLAPQGPEKVGEERTGRLVLDGDTIIAADGETLNQRRRMSWYGVISIAVALDGDNNLLGDPVIRLLGLPIEADVDDFLEEANAVAEKTVKDWRGDLADLQENLRLAVRRVATSWTGKKPIVEVLIVETA
jgi:ribonuclease J